MKRSVFTFLLPLVVFVACIGHATNARAAEVTLTSASAVINCTGHPFTDTGLIALAGRDFNLLFLFDGAFGPRDCSVAPVNINLRTFPTAPYDFVFSPVTFQGVRTGYTLGSLTFNETSISGFVEGIDIIDFGRVLFRVDFTATGMGSFSTTKATFNAVPEPATLALFGTSALILGAARRRRRKNRESSEGSAKIN